MIEAMKSSIKIMELASQILETKSQEGMSNLVRLGLPHNVIKCSEILVDDDKGKAQLLTAQYNPAIILLSLALEQSIKALILQETGCEQKGHNYSLLFSNVPIKLKQDIENEVIESLKISENDFELLLKSNSDVFIAQRYFYEPENHKLFNLNFIKALYNSFKSRIN
jgi:hypothetical protein